MTLFAIADLHLGFGVEKPMSIFGDHWNNHAQLLTDNWQATVSKADTVLIPGDISWGMNLDQALPDLAWLERLPGQKVLIKGNHDYWWASQAKIEALCREQGLVSLRFLRNNSFALDQQVLVCGTRGWLLPDDQDFAAADEKIYLREAGRLKMSLEDAARQRKPGQLLIACLHYPPFGRNGAQTRFTELLNAYAADLCVYGHIHGIAPGVQRAGPAGPVRYQLVAADYLAFKPQAIFSCAGNGLVI